jgi:prepilin peptidase CpaA
MLVQAANALALGIAALAVVFDLKERRVPNWLTFGGALVALGMRGVLEGLPGLESAALGWIVGLALFLPLFVLGGMGAGDVKLLATLGAFVGPLSAAWMALYGSIAGGVMALIVAVATGYLRTAVRNIWFMLTVWSTIGVRPVEGLTLDNGRGPRLAYAVPIGVGAVLTIWLR